LLLSIITKTLLVAGVPISTQWESSGYFYPTQVAQFGLAHFSRNLTEPEPRRRVIEDGSQVKASWNVPRGASISRVQDETSRILKFSAQG
jgi:heparosan-N-sulfate-glucuronate 5-epimerase